MFYTNIRQHGNDLLFLGYDQSGKKTFKKIKYSPTLYIEKPLHSSGGKFFQGIYGETLEEKNFETISAAKKFIQSYNEVQGVNVFGSDKFAATWIAENFKGQEIPYDFQKLLIFYTDIEVHSEEGFPLPEEAKYPITAITIRESHDGIRHTWTLDNSPGGRYSPHIPGIILHEFSSETEMLRDFIGWWTMNYPDIISGWNSAGFDIPYLVNRIKKLLGESWTKKLSPWGTVQQKSSTGKYGKEELSYDIWGISHLDYLHLYRKYSTTPRESYTLGFIGQEELGETKVSFDGPLWKLYNSDYQTYIEYNIQDVDLIWNLENKLQMLRLIVDVAYSGKAPMFEDAIGTVKYWEILIDAWLYDQDKFSEIKPYGSSGRNEQYEGAFVKEPVTGRHEWVCNFDFSSLYPSLIRQVNIGPETLVAEPPLEIAEHILAKISPETIVDKSIDTSLLKKYNLSLSANGKLYRKTHQSFLSELMEKFFNKRSEYKKLMKEASQNKEKHPKGSSEYKHYEEIEKVFHIKQLATKILINSAYGAVGNNFFKFFSIDNAEAITISGKAAILTMEKAINDHLNELLGTIGKEFVVAIDTDSLYIRLDDVVKKYLPTEKDVQKIADFLDKVCEKKLFKVISQKCEEFTDYLNSYQNVLNMNRENIADVAIWTGKKRYCMNVLDCEGIRYAEPKMKVTGMEVVRSSSPKVCREKLKEALKICMSKTEDDLKNFISEFEKEFKKLPAEDIAFPRSVNNIEEYSDKTIKGYKSGTPIQVRASIVHNRKLNSLSLTNSYDTIFSGSKIKYIHLKLPNPFHENVVAFKEKLPREFNIDKYIDYDEQFEKSFLSPIRNLSENIGWNISNESSLADFFG